MIVVFFAGVFPNFLSAQAERRQTFPDPIPVVKLSQSLVFDGIPDEDAWKDVPALPMTTLMPAFGKEPTETSIIKIAYDDDHFYVSGILHYEDIGNLRAVGKKRDYSSRSSSWFGFLLDTFNDRENAVLFMTNPNGTRSDATIQNDYKNESKDFNGSWNTFWDVKTAVTERGWTAGQPDPTLLRGKNDSVEVHVHIPTVSPGAP